MVKKTTTKPALEAPAVAFDGRSFAALPDESVLDVLLRNGVEAAHSCKKGTCLSCLLRTEDPAAAVPERARDGLRPTLVDQGYFLPCVTPADKSIAVLPAQDEGLFVKAKVTAKEALAPAMTRLRLAPAEPLDYRAGQFVNLRRGDGTTRSYSIASLPDDGEIELHIKKLPGGIMSTWVANEAAPGDSVELQGPNGSCYYLEGSPDKPLLLIGNGSGLAPLIGVARAALAAGHSAPIHLYHGSRHPEGLYLQDELRALDAAHANFHYCPCLSGAMVPEGHRAGRADDTAFYDHPDMSGWRVYLCGYPPMVKGAQRRAFLAGASLGDIHRDAFELRDRRQTPRD